MQLFYDPDLTTGPHVLREEEAAHAFRVLRKQVGDTLDLVDGKGGWYQAEVTSINKRQCVIDASLIKLEELRADYGVTLLVAPTKNIDRLEWVLEKATEVGVDRIVPFVSEHSERKKIRTDRLARILESAMKQSLRAWLPELTDLRTYEDALAVGQFGQQNFLAYLGDDNTPLLHHTARPGNHVTIAVGPEGGFSPREADLAKAAGYTWVSLGPNRLRTETAAITAVHTLNQLNW